MPAKINIPIGTRFGKLTVRCETDPIRRRVAFRCLCDCGNIVVATSNALRTGSTVSCGCRKTSHGRTKSVEYQTWRSMRKRCNDPSVPVYKNYGGRGISVYPQWNSSFDLFFKDVGLRPSPKHTIERINNNGNYEPGNVKWATKKEQNRNQRRNHTLTHGGQTRCITEWAEITGLKVTTIKSRLAYGWSADKTINTVPRNWGR